MFVQAVPEAEKLSNLERALGRNTLIFKVQILNNYVIL